nr:MAG TPA: hypothetical protein [Bacteriophage sp.]
MQSVSSFFSFFSFSVPFLIVYNFLGVLFLASWQKYRK